MLAVASGFSVRFQSGEWTGVDTDAPPTYPQHQSWPLFLMAQA